MKKIITIITCSFTLLLFSHTALSQVATTNEPAIDNKRAEALKKQPANITVAPDKRQTVERKMQQETVTTQQEVKKESEELLGKGVKVDPRAAPVAKERPVISTLDPNKQPPPRVFVVEATLQKTDQ